MKNHESLQALPPVGVAGLTLWGIGLSDWVLMLTAVYTIFLLVDKLPVILSRIAQLYRCVRDWAKT